MNRTWLEPWNEVSMAQKVALPSELHQLLTWAHPLFGVKAEAIGSRLSTREILFKINGSQLVVIELTRFGNKGNEYPRFEMYPSWLVFARQRMRADHAADLFL